MEPKDYYIQWVKVREAALKMQDDYTKAMNEFLSGVVELTLLHLKTAKEAIELDKFEPHHVHASVYATIQYAHYELNEIAFRAEVFRRVWKVVKKWRKQRRRR